MIIPLKVYVLPVLRRRTFAQVPRAIYRQSWTLFCRQIDLVPVGIKSFKIFRQKHGYSQLSACKGCCAPVSCVAWSLAASPHHGRTNGPSSCSVIPVLL